MEDFEFYTAEELRKSHPQVHSTALVARGAEIDQAAKVGPNALIGPKVKLAAGVKVHLGAAVTGITAIDEGTEIHPYATVGTVPQDLKYSGEETRLKIGKNNQIREYVNISIGTQTGLGETVIGDSNLFMAYSHIAHDCIVGNHVIIANGVQIAGHAVLGDRSVFGGLAGIHQFSKIGAYAMIGAGAIVVQDVLPFSMVQGDRARPIGLNVVGIRRGPFSKDEVSAIKQCYKIIYNEGLTAEAACEKVQKSVAVTKIANLFTDFLKSSDRGIVR